MNIFHVLFTLALLVTGSNCVENEPFYHDLTEIIDNCLKRSSTDKHKFALEEALKKSTYVYYSTDLLLNNIEYLVPIFSLLNKAKPRSSRYYLMLSLRFTNYNRFLWPRLDDVFYNLSLDIAPETKILLRRHLTSIVLDWRVDTCEASSSFFSRTAYYPHTYGFNSTRISTVDTTITSMPYSFPKYIKNFLGLYCGESNECSNISLGVAYNAVQIGCADYLLNQIRDVDFILIFVTFSSHREFPFSYEIFRLFMATLEYQNERFIGRKFNKRILHYVDIQNPPTVFQVREHWKQEWGDLEALLSSSKYFQETVQNLIDSTHEKAIYLLKDYMLKYTSYYNLKISDFGSMSSNKTNMKFNSVLGKSVIWESSLKFDQTVNIESASGELLVPHLCTDEVEITPCSLKYALTGRGNEKIIIDVYTWRAILRHQKQLKEQNISCNTNQEYNGVNENISHENVAILIFDEKLIAMWSGMEKYMVELFKEHQNIGTTLETIVFPEDGFTHAIQSFIASSLSKYSLGCVVDFNQEKLEIIKLKMLFSEKLKFYKVMKELCSSVFEEVETMIWNIDKVDIAGGKELMVVARQIFMKEFPEKLVLIQLAPGSRYSSDYISSWSQYYNIPVAI